MELFLERAAYVEVIGRHIKEDDVQDILAHKANAVGSFSHSVKIRINFVSKQDQPGTPNAEDDSNSHNVEEE